MRYAVSVLMDCPRCGDEAELIVQYGGSPSRHLYADSVEIKDVDVSCANGCALTPDERAVLEEEAIAIAQTSPVHAEVTQ